MENVKRLAVQLVNEIEALGEVKEASKIDFGVMVEVESLVIRGLV